MLEIPHARYETERIPYTSQLLRMQHKILESLLAGGFRYYSTDLPVSVRSPHPNHANRMQMVKCTRKVAVTVVGPISLPWVGRTVA